MSKLDKVLIGFLLLGIVVALISFFRGILIDRRVQVEYLNGGGESRAASGSGIYVDIEGAIMSPGVYWLAENARIKDLLVLAGGFSARADRDYSEKNLNLAQILKDGQKIYIPETSSTPGIPGYPEAEDGLKRVNVNTASLSELDTLWGVGPARAATIVKNRPYGSLEELVSKGGMTKAIWEKNQERIGLF